MKTAKNKEQLKPMISQIVDEYMKPAIMSLEQAQNIFRVRHQKTLESIITLAGVMHDEDYWLCVESLELNVIQGHGFVEDEQKLYNLFSEHGAKVVTGGTEADWIALVVIAGAIARYS